MRMISLSPSALPTAPTLVGGWVDVFRCCLLDRGRRRRGWTRVALLLWTYGHYAPNIDLPIPPELKICNPRGARLILQLTFLKSHEESCPVSARAPTRCTRALLYLKFGRPNPNSVAVRPFSGRFLPKHAPRVPGFGYCN
jgi:hypothetical protein